MTGVQLIALVFILFMLYVVRIHYKKHEIPQKESFFWYLLWAGIALIVIFPASLRSVATEFSITRLLDLLSIAAFMILFFVVIQDRIHLYKIDKKLEKIVRERTISRPKKKTTK